MLEVPREILAQLDFCDERLQPLWLRKRIHSRAPLASARRRSCFYGVNARDSEATM
jgi:hypothetical protein